MIWSQLWFGKYRGRTLPQIILSDPDWFFYMMEKKAFEDKGSLGEEAKEIDRKARNIRIPSKAEEDLVAEYIIHPHTHTFCNMEIVCRNKSLHEGSSPAYRNEVIDLSFPREFACYDKLGCWKLLRSLKFYIFGDEKFRLTKQKCETFFNDDTNFVLS